MTNTEKKKHFFENHILDLYQRASCNCYPVFTDFLTTGEQALLNGLRRQFHQLSDHTSVALWGGHYDCSYVVAGFFPEEYQEYSMTLFPVTCICIKPVDTRYTTPLTHRDYLGAILNLGIERSMIGDIRIEEYNAFVFCKKEISSFIQEKLRMVKHTAVICSVIENIEEIPKQQFEVFYRSVASPRLDNVVAAMVGKARGKAAELITQGKVIVDSSERTSVSYLCKDGCIISVRGYGKFRLGIPEDSVTAKGKQKIQIYKYK